MGSWFKLFVLLALHFPPCLPWQLAASSVSPAYICYRHVKQKLKLRSHVGAHNLLILPQEKEVPSASSGTRLVTYTAEALKRWWDLRKSTLCGFLLCKSVSGLIRRFLQWAQHCTNMASGNMGIDPKSFIYMGSCFSIKAFRVLLLFLCIHLRFFKQLTNYKLKSL